MTHKLQIIQRDCRGCTACCTVKEVYEINKPPGVKCPAKTDFGCSIYGRHPKSCQQYMCMWRFGFLETDLWPATSGVIIDVSSSMFIKDDPTALDITVIEVWRGAAKPQLNKILKNVLQYIRTAQQVRRYGGIVVFPFGTMLPDGTRQHIVNGVYDWEDGSIVLAEATGRLADENCVNVAGAEAGKPI